MTVRVRFAPSPTGYLHIGGARTALFNWLFARGHGGQFILRIEDTDQNRYVEESLDDIMDSLRWLGLDWDEGPDIGGPFAPYVQSERADLYREWAGWLIEHGHAYTCYCTPEELKQMRKDQKANNDRLGYDRRCRHLTPTQRMERNAAGLASVVRFAAPLTGETTFHDAIRGDITYNNEQITDQVLLKSDGLPTYHLANVVDDHFMQITHIMRADEWLNTAPLHVNLYKAFGWEQPVLAHLPVVLSPSGRGKLSKRDQAFEDGNDLVLVQVRDYKTYGYLPEAVDNFLSNVGWSFGDDVEKFTIEEAAPRFELESINPAATNLPYGKLDWLNGQYIQEMGDLELAIALKPHLEEAGYEVNVEALLAIMPPMKVRLKRLTDGNDFLRFLFDDEAWQPDPARFHHKRLVDPRDAFMQSRDFVRDVDLFTVEEIADGLRAIGEQVTDSGSAGPLLGVLRYAVTGQQASPPLFESIVALGRARTVERLDRCIEMLS
jgi:glutamyl-tRNA synthetase